MNVLSFKEFVRWCNERACDGCWSMGTSIMCMRIIHAVNDKPFWKRKKAWAEINEDDNVYKSIVEPINKLIAKNNGKD